ncbi:YbaK/prolyl-tRNA synthetase associated domain-containing protein [Escherichia coli]|uniref:YbaK/prolyl-tRNA synthetase associated domain-containing protein n=1 Tax=Escherichia coli TaxID=562 RepID=UPI0013656157|nr:YbaK/prolyl-tRNA synthetase associated domain-containing protein [Escherichia coli]MWT74202.1 YbaK/prolyl-tRNA synthetase associated domain-containing protein [Escherichia coli]
MTTACSPHEMLLAFLSREKARYQHLRHPAAGKSEDVARVRGTEIGQGAKALVCKLKGNGKKDFVLAVLAADLHADLTLLGELMGARKASLASVDDVRALTGCVPGSIPPFSFHTDLKLVADPEIFARYTDIAFNAGSLEDSVILSTEDYLRIARPQILQFSRHV